jgi:hypothetical protein
MATKVYKFKDIVELQHFLNGGVVGGRAEVVNSIVDKTLIINGTTVTFAAAGQGVNGDSYALRFKDIRTQIMAQVATVDVLLIDGKIAIILKVPGAVTIDKDGTANTLLGFDPQVDTVTKLYAKPGSVAPAWEMVSIGLDNSHVLLTSE